MHSPLLSLFLFQMQKKQKGQERFGRHHNTEVTLCAIVEVGLFLSYCPVRIKDEIKAMLMERGGQSPAGADGCWRGDELTCVPPPALLGGRSALFALTTTCSESIYRFSARDLQFLM